MAETWTHVCGVRTYQRGESWIAEVVHKQENRVLQLGPYTSQRVAVTEGQRAGRLWAMGGKPTS